MSDASATLGNGRFTLHSLLGEGGMARVYRAYDHRLRRWRAIKMLLPEFAQRQSVRGRFEAEAQALAILEHPNVVRIYDVGGSEDQSYIVMELCDGGAVGDWLLTHGVMPARMAVEVVLAAADGMQAAHEAAIIHRDLKPGNLLIDRRGRVKITDFGIARTEALSTTRTGSSMGTLGYMAPEQNDDAKTVDARTDVYALGATLYTLVTGNTDPHLFTVDREPERLDDVPAALRPVLMRAVAYAASDRYPSMTALAEALASVRAELPELDADAPPLLDHAPPAIEPPPEPLVMEPAPDEPAPATPVRATVPDTMIPAASESPASGLVDFEVPADAPEPFLAMTPGAVQRTERPAPSSAARHRFDDLYVTEEPKKEPKERFVGTMVGWQPKTRERADLDRAARDGQLPAEPAAGPGSRWLAKLRRLIGVRAAILAAGLGTLLIGLAVISVYGQAMTGAQRVEGFRQSYWSASRRFVVSVEEDPTLPQDLAGSGGDESVLLAAMADYRAAATRQAKRDAAEALAALMSAEYSVLSLQGKLSADAQAALGTRVRAIQSERTAADEARSNWRAAAESFGGSWAVRMGAAVPPSGR